MSNSSSSYQGQVGQDFDDASESYDGVAHIQHQQYLLLYEIARRELGQPLLQALCEPESWALDVGSGPGQGLERLKNAMAQDYLSAHWIAMDLSAAMMARQGGTHERIVADMNALPLADHSINILCSNFSLHWSLAPQVAAQEMVRVLKPGGVALVSVPLHGSLQLLEDIWFAHGLSTPLHSMPIKQDLLRFFKTDSVSLYWQESVAPLGFSTAKALFAWLRKTGVTQKRDTTVSAKKVTRRQYLSIVKSLNIALAERKPYFSMLNIVLHRQWTQSV